LPERAAVIDGGMAVGVEDDVILLAAIVDMRPRLAW
jgi:hypothetical protein